MKRCPTVALGSPGSPPAPPGPRDRSRRIARARGTEDVGAVGSSPPGRVGPRRTDRHNSRIGSLLGRYAIVQRLGSGGTSLVYLARTSDPGSAACALKIMRRKFAGDADLVERFEQEATLMGRVSHPAMPRVLDQGRGEDGVPYLVMELLEGYTLASRMDISGPLALGDILDIAAQAADALVAVHAAGIVHCDVKPDNLFLVTDPSRPSGYRVMLIDFGVASQPTAGGEAAGQGQQRRLGTPAYMAPEQCRRDAALDQRTDVYSFGCLLYEMLCGQAPFGGSMAEILSHHQHEAAPRPGGLRPDTPAALDELVLRMLAKDPDARPPSMSEVQAALSEAGAVRAP